MEDNSSSSVEGDFKLPLGDNNFAEVSSFGLRGGLARESDTLRTLPSNASTGEDVVDVRSIAVELPSRSKTGGSEPQRDGGTNGAGF